MVSEGPDWMGATVGMGEDKKGVTVNSGPSGQPSFRDGGGGGESEGA